MKVLLLSADKYSFKDESGSNREGCTAFYLNNYRSDNHESLGLKPTKLGASLDVFNQINLSGVTLPAWANVQLDTRPGAQNKASLVLVHVELIEEQELF